MHRRQSTTGLAQTASSELLSERVHPVKSHTHMQHSCRRLRVDHSKGRTKGVEDVSCLAQSHKNVILSRWYAIMVSYVDS